MRDFVYTDSNKRYHTQNYSLRKRFGKKVIKISLNGGFTCPNKDGTKGVGGCIYCSNSGSGEFGGNPAEPLKSQFNEVRERLRGKWSDALYIAYFQANSGTYAPLERLKALYEEALGFENTVGLAIATRPDCIDDATADYLAELSEKTYLTVELGLQTVHDSTAKYLNRCHTYGDFLSCCEKLSARKINICAHIIDGLPGETREMMLETAAELAKLGLHSLKIHMLQLIDGTALARLYKEQPFHILSRDEYISIVCDQLELIPPQVVIQRLTGDGDKRTLLAPLWCIDKKPVLNGIDKELLRRQSRQGSRLNG